jgi:hypothetical protein
MIIIGLIVAVLAGYFWLCRAPGKHEAVKVSDPNSRRMTSLGMVTGFANREGTHAWLSIPYAQAPGPICVGERLASQKHGGGPI